MIFPSMPTEHDFGLSDAKQTVGSPAFVLLTHICPEMMSSEADRDLSPALPLPLAEQHNWLCVISLITQGDKQRKQTGLMKSP